MNMNEVFFIVIITLILYLSPLYVAWMNVNRFSITLDRIAIGFIWAYVMWLASVVGYLALN